VEGRTAQGFESLGVGEKLGMNWRWGNGDGCRTHIALRGRDRWQRYVECLATRRHGSLSWYGGEKNDVRRVRTSAVELLRPTSACGAGPIVRRYAHLPCRGHASPHPPIYDRQPARRLTLHDSLSMAPAQLDLPHRAADAIRFAQEHRRGLCTLRCTTPADVATRVDGQVDGRRIKDGLHRRTIGDGRDGAQAAATDSAATSAWVADAARHDLRRKADEVSWSPE
jgi:hypothetical protein